MNTLYIYKKEEFRVTVHSILVIDFSPENFTIVMILKEQNSKTSGKIVKKYKKQPLLQHWRQLGQSEVKVTKVGRKRREALPCKVFT